MSRLSVQSLRGFACLILLVYHVVGSSPAQGLQVQGGWLRIANDALAAVRMPMFALLAGSLYGLGRARGLVLLKDKFQRLLLPMFTVGTAFALLQYHIHGANHPVQELHLLHAVPVAHYWFLESLFLVFCLMAVLEAIHALDHPSRWCVVFLASCIAYVMQLGVFWFGILGAVYLLPYFLLGLGLTRFQWDIHPAKATVGRFSLLCGVSLLAVLICSHGYSDRFSAGMLACGLLLAGGLWLQPLRHAMLACIGEYSYAIFLFHVFFTAATRIVLNAVGVNSFSVHLFLALVAGAAGPVAIHFAIMLSPRLRFWILGSNKGERKAASQGAFA